MHLISTIIGSVHSFPLTFGGVQADDVFLGSPPLAFVIGFGYNMLLPLLAGVPSVILEGRMSVEAMLEAVPKYKVTMFNAVPTAFNQMLNLPNIKRLRPQHPAGRHVRQRPPAAVDLPGVQGPDRPGDRERYRLVGVHRDPARLLPARLQAGSHGLAGPRRSGQDHRRRGQRVRSRRHRPPARQGLLRHHVLAQRGAAKGGRGRRLESLRRLRLQGRGRSVLARVPHRRHHKEPGIPRVAGRGGRRAQRARGGVRIHASSACPIPSRANG